MDGWIDRWTLLLFIAIAAALFVSLRSLLGGNREQVEALQQHAQKSGRRFVRASEGGPAVRFDAGGHEGEARFRSGKRRFRLGDHVRVRIPFGGSDDFRLRIAPPMLRHGQPTTMVYPSPVSSDGRLRDDLYDIHASSDALLDAALAGGRAALLTRRHPDVWLEIKNGRVEVRLAGEADQRLVAEAIELAIGLHERTRAISSNA